MDAEHLNDLFIGYEKIGDYFDFKLKLKREEHTSQPTTDESPDWVINTEKYNGFNGNINRVHNLYRSQDDPKWEPTPEEIRECCGVWVAGDGNTPWTNIKHINPDMVNGDFYNDIHDFRACFNGWDKLEPIPEQCIPKPEPERERYEWAGIVEEWM